MSQKVGDTSDTEMSHSITLPCELCLVNVMVERQCRKSKSKSISNPLCVCMYIFYTSGTLIWIYMD